MLVNLTPDPIVIVDFSGQPVKKIEPSGCVVSTKIGKKQVCEVDGVPVYEVETDSRIANELPEHKKGIFYIVDPATATALAMATGEYCSPVDVLVVGKPVYDGNGTLIGYDGLYKGIKTVA